MIETARGTVHEWQRDHMGHINVRAYMEFFEEACWQFYAMLGMTPSLLRSGALHLAAVQQNISYRRELYPGDTVAVRTGVLEMREKVLRFRHELFNTETGDVASICEFTVVCLDPGKPQVAGLSSAGGVRARELILSDTAAGTNSASAP
jgi:acyl-CoA thioester hydrolase